MMVDSISIDVLYVLVMKHSKPILIPVLRRRSARVKRKILRVKIIVW